MEGLAGMSIRKMRPCDYEGLHALWLRCPGMGLNDVDDTAEGIARLLGRNPETCLVAVDDATAQVVGGILVGTDGRRAYVYHTAVEPALQGRGIGRALVEAELAALRALGVSKVALVAFRRNDAGNAFWERMGFGVREDICYRDHALVRLVRTDT